MSASPSKANSPATDRQQSVTRVLFVDDDLHLLQGLARSLREHLEVFTAPDAVEALRVLDREGPFPVLVTDQNMPQVDGISFLKKAAQHFPDTVRIMLTGNADQKAAERAVNVGGVYRFLSKPCATEELLAAISAAQREHDRRFAQRQVLEETVSGVTTLLTDMLAMAYPQAFARSGLVRRWADTAAKVLSVPDPWALRTAAVLWPLSHVMMPAAMPGAQSANRETIAAAYMSVAKLLRNVPRFRGVAELLVDCRKDASGAADQQRPSVEAELLRILIDLSVLIDPAKPACIDDHIVAVTKGANRAIVAALPAILASADLSAPSSVLTLSAFEIGPGDMLLTDLTDDDGRLLLASGQSVSDSIATKIRQISGDGNISGRFKVVRG